ncbi:MAG TPA: hypothetical protein VFM38_07140 [Candidatus Limnocylindrales bacterium]|nr:hypothetical protein [Candidatus Limnocylindrales bacterium]
MPSGTATRLGDVLTIHGGKTVEVVNADAEGRLVMADAIVMAVEAGVDAIVTVATLTGAAMRTFGTAGAAMLANSRDIAAQLTAAGDATDEPVFELPLIAKYRPMLDSAIATSRTWAARMPAPSPPRCSSKCSPRMCRSVISTSADR